MAKNTRGNRSDHPPYARGPKTHKADVRINRGEPEAPAPERQAKADEVETAKQEQIREEHPTRMTETGRVPDRRNR